MSNQPLPLSSSARAPATAPAQGDAVGLGLSAHEAAQAADCANEPIRIPESIQPHGFLLAVDSSDWRIRRASANLAAFLGVQATDALGQPVGALFAAQAPELADELRRVELKGLTLLQPVVVGDTLCNVAAHRVGDVVVVEFEPRDDARSSLDLLYPQIRAAVEEIQSADTPEQLFRIAGAHVRDLTGFDRVLIYRFDAQWNGRVVGEERNDALPSYLDLRFPATDIPAQARELYAINRIRIIPDANYEPVPLISGPTDTAPLDMTASVLRSVSPVHVQYMRNMGTPASMSISILQDGKLWGLVSCHHSAPRRVASHVRAACDFLVQILGMQLVNRDRSADSADRVQRQQLHATLLGNMAREQHYVDGLLRHPEPFLGIADASGAAVVIEGQCAVVGRTPGQAQITGLVQWLSSEHANDELYVTDCLSADFPEAEAWAATASGVLAISISQLHRSYIVWFRPEVVRTVNWGGDPRKSEVSRPGPLSPRTSFETWKETVRLQSEPWAPSQVETVLTLRNSIIGIVMRNAEELADLAQELKRINAELEAFSYSVSHDLRAPFRHIVGYAELLRELPALSETKQGKRYVSTIIDSAHTAGKLVDGLLSFSQTGRISLSKRPVAINDLVRDCLRVLEPEMENRVIEWDIGDLGRAVGDANMFRQVFQNLLSNAIKYSRTREVAKIAVAREVTSHEIVFSVSDNGVGFDMRYIDKLFGVFQRLHRMEEFEGTGIGLANVKRIAQRHGGRAWAEGRLGEGATFYFSIPKNSD